MEVKLHGTWASPFSNRVELALKIKGVPYEFIEEDLSNKTPELIKYNPVHQKVPVLVHNGKPIAESLVILEYVDETWPANPIMPHHPYHKATTRFWAKFVDEKILTTASKFRRAKDEEEKKQAIEELLNNLKFLDNELKEKDYFEGERIGFVDISLIFIINWFLVMQEISQADVFNEDRFPALFKWFGKLLEIDVVKECLPPRDKHLEYARAKIGAVKYASG